ncbi:MAG: flagellar motor switch protein FliG [Cyanobacteria bacterium P01_H01_bin.74]
MTQSQKVAALLIALGPKTASQILKSMQDNSDVEMISLEIASMQKIPPETLGEILAEFYKLFEASGYLATGGVGYARKLLEDAFGDTQADKILERLVANMQANPFDFFNNADPAQLATSFQSENPQLVALVLAYLKPDRAAGILSDLSPEMQSSVALRIADMDRTNPEVLREVERIMENKFSSVVNTDFTQAGGVESLADIINRSDRTTEKAILDSLEVKDQEIAEQVRELMFVFEDIVQLDDKFVQRFLREVDTKDLALSLKGANEEVKDKIFKNMSERASAILKDDMDYMGAVRAKDVQEKQTYVVSVIRALESAGEISILRSDEADDFIN